MNSSDEGSGSESNPLEGFLGTCSNCKRGFSGFCGKVRRSESKSMRLIRHFGFKRADVGTGRRNAYNGDGRNSPVIKYPEYAHFAGIYNVAIEVNQFSSI